MGFGDEAVAHGRVRRSGGAEMALPPGADGGGVVEPLGAAGDAEGAEAGHFFGAQELEFGVGVGGSRIVFLDETAERGKLGAGHLLLHGEVHFLECRELLWRSFTFLGIGRIGTEAEQVGWLVPEIIGVEAGAGWLAAARDEDGACDALLAGLFAFVADGDAVAIEVDDDGERDVLHAGAALWQVGAGRRIGGEAVIELDERLEDHGDQARAWLKGGTSSTPSRRVARKNRGVRSRAKSMS